MSFINEMASICIRVDAVVLELVALGRGLDKRIRPKLKKIGIGKNGIEQY